MEIMITVREDTREETLILDDGLMIQETLGRLAAKGIFSRQAADCCYVRSRLCREVLCTAQSFVTARIVSGDALELI